METKTGKASVGSAYGIKLDKPIEFSFKYQALNTPEEVRAAQEWPSDADIVEIVNVARANNARQKEQKVVLEAAGYKQPTLKDSEVLQLRTIYRSLMASKRYTHQQAVELAATTLQTSWPEGSQPEEK